MPDVEPPSFKRRSLEMQKHSVHGSSSGALDEPDHDLKVLCARFANERFHGESLAWRFFRR